MRVSTLCGRSHCWVLLLLSTAALLLVLAAAPRLAAQSELATVFGRVTDPAGAVVAAAEVEIKNVETSVSVVRTTNSDGLYSIPSLHPGHYLLSVRKPGFKTVTVTEIALNVQDNVVRNFQLQVGSVSESITVTADQININTTDASVSTVVDRQFAENLPMNGRSFQTLIQLTPGVVLTANNGVDTGQFSVNGQRAASNYWMVDGVGANIGISGLGGGGGNGLGGAAASTSVLGGTNSLVSVDALQEFRVQTSTFAPEFGRTPGGQISIVTRSGTNQFHGTVFDYLRNDIFDANDWFNGYTHNPPLPKAEERQNDFGGTLGGPILKNRTFFFLSYEGLRLRLPQTLSTFVPDLTARENAEPAVQTFLNAFPVPNGPDDLSTNIAQYSASLSNPATLDAASVRIDHKVGDKLALFGRYDYSPSNVHQRGSAGDTLSNVLSQTTTTRTATVGLTWMLSPVAANDFRFNYSRTEVYSSAHLDSFGGAVPPAAFPFPSPFTTQSATFSFAIPALGNNFGLGAGPGGHNAQRQINLVNNVSLQKGAHAMKLGVDFRRLAPREGQPPYELSYFFSDVPSAETGTSEFNIVFSGLPATFLFRNLGVFVQDTWRVISRLTLTYGLRWDIDFVPTTLSGPSFNAVTGFDLANLSNLALLPVGTPPYSTTYGNVAPRIGLAYQLIQNPDRQAVLRGGVGVFYDLANSEGGNIAQTSSYPLGAFAFPVGSFPLSATDAAPPPIVPPNAINFGALNAFDPHLKLPRIFEWNAALEQSLGKQQTLTASYVGSVGRRLLQTALIEAPNQNVAFADFVTNSGTSDYHALQLQFQRRLSRGLQALASYTWSHSIDTGSAGSATTGSNALAGADSKANRGPSDFDRRNAFSAALTYDLPSPHWSTFANVVLRGWSTENVVQAQSAPPVDVYYSFLGFGQLATGFLTSPRPDLVGSQPLYLFGSQYPGGKAFNNMITPGACPDGSDMLGPFCPPPTNASGFPARQGTLGRNALRGFGMAQWDFAVHRDFPIHESVKLQFRAEMFNLLNHPNFGPPSGDIQLPSFVNPQFGLSTQMLGQSLSGGNVGTGALSPLYQVGGPRSVQLALKLFY